MAIFHIHPVHSPHEVVDLTNLPDGIYSGAIFGGFFQTRLNGELIKFPYPGDDYQDTSMHIVSGICSRINVISEDGTIFYL